MDDIQFYLNNQQHIVPSDVHPATRLSDYIRQVAHLKGTKITCREGGCGACVVTAEYIDPVTNEKRARAINSCLCPVSSVRGWYITTTEGLGGQKRGYHPIQQRLADYSATQCGFCTPGFVMSMNSLLADRGSVTCEDVEGSLDGNICRCTGYRSILSALKSFATDAPDSIIADIEDLKPRGCSKICNAPRSSGQQRPASHQSWIRPKSLDQLYELLDVNKDNNVRLVFGNTATGVYKKERYDTYVDIKDVLELYAVTKGDASLTMGSSLTLTNLIETCQKYSGCPGFAYLEQVKEILQLTANTPIRNAGSWAGNLMMMHAHPDFPSDVYTLMAALGAEITIGRSDGKKTVSVDGLFTEDMKRAVIMSVKFPALNENELFRVLRVSLRPQSAVCYVSLAALVTVTDMTSYHVEKAVFVCNGIGPKNKRATDMEDFLVGKSLRTDDILKGCLNIASNMKITNRSVHATEDRRSIMRNLLFKLLASFREGLTVPLIKRHLRTGKQDYETKPELYPETQPIPKLAAYKQCSGEIEFVDDMARLENELAGVLVLSTIGKGQIESIDVSKAKSVGGAVEVMTAADIPGQRLFNDIEIFADKDIGFNGQPIALVVADDLGAAYRAASMVRVNYENTQTPITSIREAINKKYFHDFHVDPLVYGQPESAMKTCTKFVEGSFYHGEQYHFYLENQSVLIVPSENGYDIWQCTQWPTASQDAVSSALNIPRNGIHVNATRAGGAFGGKALQSPAIAAMASVAAHKTSRPVRLVTSLETCMKITGHRPEVVVDYKVGLDDEDKIRALDVTCYWDSGYSYAKIFAPYFLPAFMSSLQGAYYCPNWHVKGVLVRTDIPMTTSMRAPVPLPANMFIEQVMEHIAQTLNENPIAFKEKHLRRDEKTSLNGSEIPDCQIVKIWNEALATAEVEKRRQEIAKFNEGSRWLKKGLAVTPSMYMFGYNPIEVYPLLLAVYGGDGTVIISHGGIEMGQGLHTKVVQVAARCLKLPIDMIKVRQADTMTSANSFVTGGSVTPGILCKTVSECCDVLLERLAPYRQKYPDDDWATLTGKALYAGVNLIVTDKHTFKECKPINYVVNAVCVAEAEVDILTGENQILRADLVIDAGQSVNPAVDVGQMEGALIMGMGLMLTEKEVRCPDSGALLTAGTWDYKPPLCKDIPADLRITLLKGQYNKHGVYPAKAVGEPPMLSSAVFLRAVKAALDASRRERGKSDYIDLYAPATPDAIQRACDVTDEDLLKYWNS